MKSYFDVLRLLERLHASDLKGINIASKTNWQTRWRRLLAFGGDPEIFASPRAGIVSAIPRVTVDQDKKFP